MKAKTLLLASVFLLTLFGILMSLSASGPQSVRIYGTPYHFLQHHVIFAVLGLFCAAIAYRFDYHFWLRISPLVYLVAIALLAAVLVFDPFNGARRWIRFAGLTFQSSEVAKFALVASLAAWFSLLAPSSAKAPPPSALRARLAAFSARSPRAARWVLRLLVPSLILGLPCVLVILEPDFGTTVLLGCTAATMMFVCGTPILSFAALFLLAVAGISVLVYFDPVRSARVTSFLHPEAYPESGYQLKQALYAFINGGAFGQGLGNSVQKILYLPEAHTDFIFAIIGEELGFFATFFILLLFAVFFCAGLRISARARDPEGRLLAFGITVLYALQALINMAVVVGIAPTKGLPLPFISYGGTSFLVTISTIGVLARIASEPEFRPR